jgi:hypothetical protein
LAENSADDFTWRAGRPAEMVLFVFGSVGMAMSAESSVAPRFHHRRPVAHTYLVILGIDLNPGGK